MDAIVMHDPAREIAAIVDLETMRALGPVSVGADAPAQLQQFISAMPASVLALGSFELTNVYMEYWSDHFQSADTTTPAPESNPVEPPPTTAGDATAVATVATGAPSDEPPAAAPHDTDQEAATPPAASVITCPSCAGQGTITIDQERGPQPCNMCQGKGTVTVNGIAAPLQP